MPITKRVSGPVSSTVTRRLVPKEIPIDPWDGAWGEGDDNAWGLSWLASGFGLGLTENATKRVASTPTPNITKRVTGI